MHGLLGLHGLRGLLGLLALQELLALHGLHGLLALLVLQELFGLLEMLVLFELLGGGWTMTITEKDGRLFDDRLLSERNSATEIDELIEALRAGVPSCGLHEDNNTELFSIDDADETMAEAADTISRLREALEKIAKSQVQEYDEDEDCMVWVPMDADEAEAIARAALGSTKS